jgi:hypothetical protein
LRAKRESEKKHNREKENRRKTLRNDSSSSTNKKVKKKDCSFAKNIWCSKGLTALFEDSFDFLRNAPRLSFGAGNFFTFFFFRESEREREFVRKK